ncbi:MAG: YaeQ family protein [Bacteriovorax sp.]
MALKATIYKAKLSVANLNIHHYQDYNLTIAKHPSETNLRMMYRIVAFALLCQENLEFTKGLSTDSEPDLWKINYDGSVDHWIELGHPDERRIRQICSKAKQVSIYTYQDNTSLNWFKSIESVLHRFDHLSVTHLTVLDGQNIEDIVERGMNFSVSIEDNELWLSNEKERINLEINCVKKPSL